MSRLTQILLDGVTYDIGSDSVYGGLEVLDITLPVANWSSNAQTVTVSSNASLTSDFIAIPQASTASDYGDAGALLSSVSVDVNNGTASFTFACSETPEVALKVLVLVSNSSIGTVGTGDGILHQTVTLSSSSWTLSSGLYTQSASITWMLNSDVPFCQADITTSAQADAWAAICKAESLAGSIKFYALEQPTESLSIQVAIVR